MRILTVFSGGETVTAADIPPDGKLISNVARIKILAAIAVID
jgi:hypothetical protein